MAKHTITVELEHSEVTDTILLSYEIGTADLPHGRKMSVLAIGGTVRFTISGLPGYVDLPLGDIAHTAAVLLTEDNEDEDDDE